MQLKSKPGSDMIQVCSDCECETMVRESIPGLRCYVRGLAPMLTNPRPIRILTVDDHALLREGIAALVRSGKAAGGFAGLAVTMVAAQYAASLRLDLVTCRLT
jgi:hypothetical protein